MELPPKYTYWSNLSNTLRYLSTNVLTNISSVAQEVLKRRLVNLCIIVQGSLQYWKSTRNGYRKIKEVAHMLIINIKLWLISYCQDTRKPFSLEIRSVLCFNENILRNYLRHWPLINSMWPSDAIDGDIGSVSTLPPDATKPLTESILNYHQRCSGSLFTLRLTFTQFQAYRSI